MFAVLLILYRRTVMYTVNKFCYLFTFVFVVFSRLILDSFLLYADIRNACSIESLSLISSEASVGVGAGGGI